MVDMNRGALFKNGWGALSIALALSFFFAAPARTYGQSPYRYFTPQDEVVGILEQRIRDFTANAASGSLLRIAMYEMDDGGDFVDLVDALKDAHDSANVTVQVVADGGKYDDGDFDSLVDYGITVVPSTGSQLMHNKFILFDDTNDGSAYDNWVWTGSYNLTNNAQNSQKNNVVLVKSADLASTASGFGHEFEEMWAGRFGGSKQNPREGTFTVDDSSVYGSFHFVQDGHAREALIDAINTADEAIYFNIFAFTDEDVYNAIKDRIEGGYISASDVHGNFDNWWHNDGDYYDELLALGCDVHLVGSAGSVYIHDKYMVIDPDETGDGADPILVTGSANWTGSGFNSNDENLVVFHDPSGSMPKSYRDDQQGAVPEPSTAALFIIGGSAAAILRFRRSRLRK